MSEQTWLNRILQEYAAESTKAACEACDDCGPVVMCRFHSLISLLEKDTFLDRRHFLAALSASGAGEDGSPNSETTKIKGRA